MWWIGPLGVLFLVVLLLALHVWSKRRFYERRVRDHDCPLCGKPFAEAIVEYVGPVPPAHLDRLDNFQRRFARFEVRCHECNSLAICAEDGSPIKAIVEEE